MVDQVKNAAFAFWAETFLGLWYNEEGENIQIHILIISNTHVFCFYRKCINISYSLVTPPSSILSLVLLLTLHRSPSFTVILYIPCTSASLCLSASVSNSPSTSSKTSCFSAVRFLHFSLSLCFLVFFWLLFTLFSVTLHLHFYIIPYAVCPSTPSTSLIYSFHCTVTICIYLLLLCIFFCLFNSELLPLQVYLLADFPNSFELIFFHSSALIHPREHFKMQFMLKSSN